MSIGGNKRFKDFIESYNFDPEVSIPTKYYSKAAEYYRELIKAEAEFRRLTYPPPSAAEGLESCMSIPEIKNKETPQPNNSSWWGGARNMLGSALGKAGEWASSAAETVKDTKIIESLKSGANTVYEKSKEVGGNLAEKVNQGSLKNIGEKSLEVMSNVKNMAYNSVQNAFSNGKTEDKSENSFEESKEMTDLHMYHSQPTTKYLYGNKDD